MAHSPALYEGMRWVGAGYLIVLGAVPLLAPLLGRVVAPAGRHAAPVERRSGPAGAFAAGLGSDLLNPKIGLS